MMAMIAFKICIHLAILQFLHWTLKYYDSLTRIYVYFFVHAGTFDAIAGISCNFWEVERLAARYNTS